MFWDKLAKTWERLISPLVTPFGADGDASASGVTAIDTKIAGEVAHEEMRPRPYSPDYRNERSESSLHLSC